MKLSFFAPLNGPAPTFKTSHLAMAFLAATVLVVGPVEAQGVPPTDPPVKQTAPMHQSLVRKVGSSMCWMVDTNGGISNSHVGMGPCDMTEEKQLFIQLPTGELMNPATKMCVIGDSTSAPAKTAAPAAPDPYWSVSRECYVCAAPPMVCGTMKSRGMVPVQTCAFPENFCMNSVTAMKGGAKQVSYTCASRQTCELDWYKETSDVEFCQGFDETKTYTELPVTVKNDRVTCTYCCSEDRCNGKIKPDLSTLWTTKGHPGRRRHLADKDDHLYLDACDSVEDSSVWTIDGNKAQTKEGYCATRGKGTPFLSISQDCSAVSETFEFVDYTSEPSSSPSSAPTAALRPPTDPPIKQVAPTTKKAGSSGDPHFKTWSGNKYDFHGGCDLVLLQLPEFAGGLGLTIQIRTKIETWWSFIEAAVVKIGDQTIEIQGSETEGGAPLYWVNGLAGHKEVDQDENLKSLVDGLALAIKGFDVHHRQASSKQHRFRIDLNGAGDSISIETFNSWVSVNVKAVKAANFESAMGLMGAYPGGEKLARNGTIVLEDPDQFGKEWQVLASEPMLFHSSEGTVQAPQECAMPVQNLAEKRKRRLGQSTISTEAAELACAHADDEDFDACIFDVLATQNKDMAGAY